MKLRPIHQLLLKQRCWLLFQLERTALPRDARAAELAPLRVLPERMPAAVLLGRPAEPVFTALDTLA